MKIVFFAHRYWPSIGGVEKYLRGLAGALSARGHSVSVVAGDTTGTLPAYEVQDGVSVHRYPAARSALRCRLWLWRHRRLFTHADVIQVSNTHMLEYLWRMLGPCLERRKIFLIRHGFGGIFPVPAEQKARAQRSLELASGFIHDGEFIARWLGVPADLVPAQGLNPRAVDLSPASPPPPTSAVYVGRLEPDTAISVYFDGLHELVHGRGRAMALHVYGQGSLLSALRTRAAEERLPVEFHGAVPDAQETFSQHCFAFVNGRMAMQEAMARRRPVIAAYDNPLRHDYVAGESFSPFLVAVGNGRELAERVASLIDHLPSRQALVERAYEYACGLDWSTTASAVETLWKRAGETSRNISLAGRLVLSLRLSREAARATAVQPAVSSLPTRVGTLRPAPA